MIETSFTLLTCVCVGVCVGLVRCGWFVLCVWGMCWASVGECGAWPESGVSCVGGFAIELGGQTHGCGWVVVVCGWGGGGVWRLCVQHCIQSFELTGHMIARLLCDLGGLVVIL